MSARGATVSARGATVSAPFATSATLHLEQRPAIEYFSNVRREVVEALSNIHRARSGQSYIGLPYVSTERPEPYK